ncbi:hypothetical protein [Helicobacter sp. MIT 05-5294]|nr:hypothetical protein [Helicobacter sp. MIT 05-5294]
MLKIKSILSQAILKNPCCLKDESHKDSTIMLPIKLKENENG